VATGVGGSPYYCNLYFNGVSTLVQAQNAHDDVAAFIAGLAAEEANGLSWTTQGEVQVLDEVTGDIEGVFNVTPVVVASSDGGDPLPPATQGLIRWQTDQFVDGRRVRGRTFMPWLSEARSTAGVPTAGTITDQTANAQALIDSADSALVIWSRPIEADPEANPPIEGRDGSAHSVVTGTFWDKFAVLRSRRD